jgi:hypothetical protein
MFIIDGREGGAEAGQHARDEGADEAEQLEYSTLYYIIS